MNIHKNAKLTPLGRERMVQMMLDGHTSTKAAALAGVSPVTVSRVLKRAGLSRLKDLEPAEPARRSAACSRRRSTTCIHAGVHPCRRERASCSAIFTARLSLPNALALKSMTCATARLLDLGRHIPVSQ